MDDETNKLSHKTLVLIAVLPNPKIFLSRIKSKSIIDRLYNLFEK